MPTGARRAWLVFIIVVFAGGRVARTATQQRLTKNVVTDPAAARFVYINVENFVHAMDVMRTA